MVVRAHLAPESPPGPGGLGALAPAHCIDRRDARAGESCPVPEELGQRPEFIYSCVTMAACDRDFGRLDDCASPVAGPYLTV